MRHCNFSFGTLANNYLVGCTLSDSRLLEACFDYCDLSNANLTGSELHNIHGDQLVLAGADLRATFNNIDRRIDLTGVHWSPSCQRCWSPWAVAPGSDVIRELIDLEHSTSKTRAAPGRSDRPRRGLVCELRRYDKAPLGTHAHQLQASSIPR